MAHVIHENKATQFVVDDSHPSTHVDISFYDSRRVTVGFLLLSEDATSQLLDFLMSGWNLGSRKEILLGGNCRDKFILEPKLVDGDLCVYITMAYGSSPWRCVILDETVTAGLLRELCCVQAVRAKPKSACEECGGTGKVVLFTSIRDCDCVGGSDA